MISTKTVNNVQRERTAETPGPSPSLCLGYLLFAHELERAKRLA
jgi:hypothetical protein